jgi:hypothetical protein
VFSFYDLRAVYVANRQPSSNVEEYVLELAYTISWEMELLQSILSTNGLK